MWFYLCERCARFEGKHKEALPKKIIEEWKTEKDPRATCERCGKRTTRYYVEGSWRTFSPRLLRRMGIRALGLYE